MKLKNLSLIAAAFTKCAPCALALSLTAVPFAVNAQQISQTPTQVKPDREKGPFQRLGLSEQQKTQIQEIRRNSRTKMEGILSTEQKQQLQAAKQERQGQPRQQTGQGQRPKRGFASLNLTEEQKTQMREIRESEKNQIKAILTPEQQQQFEQFEENMRSRRQRPNS